MRKTYISLGCALLMQLSNSLSAQVLLDEDFGGTTGTIPPAGWVNNDIEGGGEIWYFDNPGDQSLIAPITDPAAVFDSDYNGSAGGPENAALESPAFDASSITGYLFLSFDHLFFDDSEFGGTGAEYFVEVWDGTAWVEALSGTDDTDDDEHVNIDITALANGASDAQVRFRWTGDYGYWWIVDNVKVEVVSCAPVTDLLLGTATSSSIDISWTAGGSETAWNIEYGVSGFTQGTGTMASSASESFSAGTLTADTDYDFYVQADCGGSQSFWIGPLTGRTGYCEVVGSDPEYYINSFSTTGGAISNISNLNSGYSPNGYEDATSMSVSQFADGPSINFDAVFEGGTFGIGVWVDWNNDLVFDGSEQMFQSFDGYQNEYTGSFGVPAGVPVGSYRMRVLAAYYESSPSDPCYLDSELGEVEEYTFVVVPTPSCLPVSDIIPSNETTTTIDITWTADGSQSLWNIEWGPVGFTPGTGEGTDSMQVTDVLYTISALDPSTTYDIYVQANCGVDSSYWTMATATTLCVPIANLPWLETFDAMTDVDFDLYPNCWLSENGEWLTDDVSQNNTYNTAPYSGNNFLAIQGFFTDDYIWTPEFDLTAGGNYEFSFMWAGDGYGDWDGEAFVSESQSSSDAISIGDPFVVSSDAFDHTYRKVTYCFSPTIDGDFSFGLHVMNNGFSNNLTFDDFRLIERGATAGTDGALTVCQTEGLVNLNDIITKDDQYGSWSFAPNQATIVNDTLFNPLFVPTGAVSVNYITSECMVDTATAIITIVGPSTAGQNGSITACKNQPLNLLSGLTGVAILGGDWYDPTNTQLPGSQITTGGFPGSFNYDYVVGNGVCPDDSAEVIVNVGNCDWLSVDENELDGVNVYPNPSTGLVYIESDFTNGSFNLMITDVNGRVIETETNTITNGTNMVNLNKVQTGTYFFKLSNDKAEKVYRVVIQ